MEKSFICKALFIAAATSFAFVPNALAQAENSPFTIPQVEKWNANQGDFAFSGRVVVKGGNKVLGIAAQRFAENYKLLTGQAMTVVKGKAGKGDVVFEKTKSNKHKNVEAYTLDITGNTAVISASSLRGATWGASTLLQMVDGSQNGKVATGRVADEPEYGLRGFMIDCGRKYIPMDYLKNLVRIMSYYKMNTLQVHLNDNGFRQYFGNDWNATQAAFRLECETYPGLTAKDGSYTKKEFRDFQIWAESLGVEIIPEIDVPAHSLAFTHYRPSIGSKEYGMDHLDLFNPETYNFVDSLFMEYLSGPEPVFYGKKVHIGTDEYSNAKKDVVEKFRAFTDHYIRFVERYGKQAVVWGALTHAKGSTPVKADGVIMDCWYNGYANPKDMKKAGYKLVSIPDGLVYIVPAAGYYYDYLNCKYLYDNWTPATIGGEKFEENDPAILGGMFAVWNDHVGNGITVKDIHDRAYPALQTLSAKCWGGARPRLSYEKFDAMRSSLQEAPGVNVLARMPEDIAAKGGVYSKATVQPGDSLELIEIGYPYSVSFTINGKDEKPGTVLFKSPNATFYLADMAEGKLGFEREGYLNTFNYRVEKDKAVTITIEGDNRETRLLVNGQLREKLSPLTLYVFDPANPGRKRYADPSTPWQPEVYEPKDKIFYQRTLVFPLQKAGQFNSTISDLKVKQDK